MADTLPRDANAAADWAARFRVPQPGLCDHFVGLAYGLPNSGYESAKVHWEQTPANLKYAGDRKPPVGALVFWDTGHKYGHVAIVSGYDKSGEPLVTTTHTNGGMPTVMALKDTGMSYLGWSVPYFGGKKAEVDLSTAGEFRMAGSKSSGDVVNPNDTSGVDVTPETPDKLNKRELAAEYGYAWKLIKAVPELRKLFMEAFNNEDGQWTEKKFGAAIKGTKWYQNNAEYTREALIAQATGGADWDADVEEAKQRVQDEATRLGVNLTPDEMNAMADRYIFEGWGTSSARAKFMTEALAEKIAANPEGTLEGSSGNIAQALQGIAENNGLQYDTAYYTDAAKRVARGETTQEDEARRLRDEAASMWPTYAEQIKAGADARTLAGSYINLYAKVMERDPTSIDLNDPILRGAMTGVDEKGNFKPMGLWEFEQSLRKRPEWMNTKQGQDTTTDVGVMVLRRMGLMA